MGDIKIQGTLVNNTPSGRIAYAHQIYDVEKGMFQSEINEQSNGNSVEIKSRNLFIGKLDGNGKMMSKVGVPYQGVSVKAKLPNGIYATISDGTNTLGRVNDGETFTFASDVIFYQITFSNFSTPISELINNGSIKFTYVSDSVVERNVGMASYERALRRVMYADLKMNNMTSEAVFVHISDLHGDAPRCENAFEYADHINADCVLCTGDSSAYAAADGSRYVFDVADKSSTPLVFSVGNHDNSTNEDLLYAQPFASKYGWIGANGGNALHPYYYKDFASKKIRVINLNQYDGGTYGGQGLGGRISQSQFDFLVSALKSTPSGYGVILTYHASENKVVTPSEYEKFRQIILNGTYNENGFYCHDSRPIEKIIDAFIARSQYTSTFTNTKSETISIDVDFSDVDTRVEFLAHVCGHMHRDRIGYYDGTEKKQLVLMVTCSTAQYGYDYPEYANENDLPRGGWGVSQDAFNLYCFDRNRKYAKIVRVGANLSCDFRPRDYMEIPYSDFPHK